MPGIGKSNKSAFTSYRGTWNLPDKILTKQEAFELNGLALQTPFVGPRWIKRTTSQEQQQQEKFRANRKKSQSAKELRLLTKASTADPDLSYVPGEVVEPSIKTPSLLELEKLRLKEELIDSSGQGGNPLYLEEHNCQAEEESNKNPLESIAEKSNNETMMKYKLADKPTETEDFLPYIPAYYNFETARIMAQDNLRQPLHAVDDIAFRAMQASGDPFPGLALDVMPRTTGVGVRNFQAGPTQCTKMRIYRPKTCGIMPKPVDKTNFDRPHSSVCEKKMGPMDLAICWDYRPFDPRDEPRPPAHIDGSNGSAAPAVFAIVKTPREMNPATAAATGRSTGALFANTLGEESFFNKDLVKRHREYDEKYSMDRKCECEMNSRSVRNSAGSNGNTNRHSQSRSSSSSQRLKTTSRPASKQLQEGHQQKSIYKSSPNLTEIEPLNGLVDKQDHCHLVCISHNHRDNLQRFKSQPDLNYNHQQKQRVSRECHKATSHVAKIPLGYHKQELRPFKAGIPRNSNSFDSGLSTGSEIVQQKQVRVPKPRDPYAHKNYNIDTLAPPFACWKGGSGQGGYPEHWRLASVYQHAYKPIDQRRRPLLATVYQ